MPIPTEAGDLDRFTPSSLVNIPVPPVFLLKPGTRRDRDLYQKLLMEEGLVNHPAARLREEVLTGLEHLWDPASFERHIGRLRALWDATDHLAQRIRQGETDATLDVPQEEVDAVNTLIARITEAWPPLRKLGADNAMFAAKSPEVMMAILLAGWKGIDASYEREGGVVSLDLVEKVDAELTRLEREHADITGVGKPGTAFMELADRAGRLLFLSEDEEKNSASPPPSSQTRQGSKTAGRARTSGRSKASASSRKTPSASSRSRTSKS